MTNLHHISRLAITFPEREVFLRLGGHLTKTVLTGAESRSFRQTALQAFELCAPCGRWCIIRAAACGSGIVLENGELIPGRDFAVKNPQLDYLWCAAVTVGERVIARRDSGVPVSESAIIDAVASECADAAMDLLQKLATAALRNQALTVSPRRYSPGYGDMPLSVQNFFYRQLKLAELNIELDENGFLVPEKSVTAFAGVIKGD